MSAMKMTVVGLVLICALASGYAQTVCVPDCTGVPNGDYQSCTGCDVYVTCSNGLTYDGRPCPASLIWDDNVKRCEWTSGTCPPPTPAPTEAPTPTPLNFTVNCDNEVEAVYFDGAQQPKVANYDDWGKGGSLSVPAGTRVVAVHCSDWENGRYYHGLMASTSDGNHDTGASNSGWVCSGTPGTDWMKPGFDDSHWKTPYVTGQNNASPRGVFISNMNNAKYVWPGADRSGVGNAYCRVKLG